MRKIIYGIVLASVPLLAFASGLPFRGSSSGQFTLYDADADFLARRTGPGVVRWFGFETSELAVNGGSIQTSYGAGVNVGLDKQNLDPPENEFATDHKTSGETSLKFYINPFSNADAGGAFMTNFSPDYSVRFVEGDTFYVQWRQRFSEDFLTSLYRQASDLSATAWKQVIITGGDTDTVNKSSCTDLEVVLTNGSMKGYPQMYHGCNNVGDPIYTSLPASDFDMQPKRLCNYQLTNTAWTWPPIDPDCFPYYADEWMTFEIQITIGTWYLRDGNRQYDSTIKMWAARECQSPELVIDRSPASGTGYDIVNRDEATLFYGAVWLLPYMTGKDNTQDHPIGNTWYDELIISSSEIPFPCQDGAALPTTQ